jgi:hypothetical protein
MIRIYRFAGDDPEALGGTAERVIGDLVALEVGDDPSVVEALVGTTDGWSLYSVGGLEDLPAAIPEDVRAAIDNVVRSSSIGNVSALSTAFDKVR